MTVAAIAAERFGWTIGRILTEPLPLLMMLIRQPGPDRQGSGIGTADAETMDSIPLEALEAANRAARNR